jgi:hypothetical protein
VAVIVGRKHTFYKTHVTCFGNNEGEAARTTRNAVHSEIGDTETGVVTARRFGLEALSSL